MKNKFEETLLGLQKLNVKQVLEGFEIILGFETRNKYLITDENKTPIAYAAEAKTGFMGSMLRMFMKHWRTFDVHLFSPQKELMFIAHFPFRWFFKALYLEDVSGKKLGHLEQRFAFFSKKFDVFDEYGALIASINSPWLKAWTFEFESRGRKLGTVKKKWSGALDEFFTDRDNFTVSFAQQDLTYHTKVLMLSTCLMIDIVYFENNKGNSYFKS